MRYFIELAYRGTNYHGWQAQPNATSVQSMIEEALNAILRKQISVTGAGRTDAGVHASYFTLHFDIEKPVSESLTYKLNSFLPNDILILRILEVPDKAHARFDALSRTYRYVLTAKKHPFASGLSTFIPRLPDTAILNEASAFLLTCNDFSTFSKLHSNNKTNICRIDKAVWTNYKDFLIFTITADRFLRNMVRSLTGTLLNVGWGKLNPDAFGETVISKDRSKAGTSAPAEGLYLTDITYPQPLGLINPGKDELLPFAW